MRTAFVLALGILSPGLCQGQTDAPTKLKPGTRVVPLESKISAKDKVRVPVAYLSIEQFYARRDPAAVPPRIRVAGFYHNHTRQTVSGATFFIDRWNGKSWVTLKSGPLNAILPNQPGAESVDLPLTNEAVKVRFVVSRSVEGSKEYQLEGLAVVRSKVKPTDKVVPLPTEIKASPFDTGISLQDKVVRVEDRIKPPPFDTGISLQDSVRVATPFLSIDQMVPLRTAATVMVRATLTNNNAKPVAGATYTFERWNGTGWSTIKSAALPTVAARGDASVYAELPMSFDAIKFRVKVSQSVQGTKEVSLPQRLFVVKYRCPDWQVYASFEQESSYLLRRTPLNDLGFETKVADTYHDNFFDTYHSITLSYRCVNLQERAFPTPEAARAFQATLPKQGVLTNIVER